MPADNSKPSKKVFSGPIAEQQHLRGGAVGITAESAPERKARGWGLRPPYTTYNTASRTILAHTARKLTARLVVCLDCIPLCCRIVLLEVALHIRMLQRCRLLSHTAHKVGRHTVGYLFLTCVACTHVSIGLNCMLCHAAVI